MSDATCEAWGAGAAVVTFPTQPFLGYRLAAVSVQQFELALLRAMREKGSPFVVTYLNAATVNLAFESTEYARLLARMDCLYADGQAVVWAARWLGKPIPQRVNAGDFTNSVLRMVAKAGLKLALVGGRPGEGSLPGEAERAGAVFTDWQSKLNIVYTHDGFFSDEEAPAIRAALEAADPDLILLGMGSPRQERWALEWSAGGRPRAWWCVGALFEYYAGTRRRAPVWMRQAGLEWLFRLVLEPGRLWHRYVIGNPKFIARVLRRRPPEGLGQGLAEGQS